MLRLLPFPVHYSSRYEFPLGEHVFPARKYRLIRDRLVELGWAGSGDFMEPCSPATNDDMRLVHTAEWIEKLTQGKLSLQEAMRLEIPLSQQLLQALWCMTGGTIAACRTALWNNAVGFNLGGGFHHAFAGHGEGFCAINDIAVAIRKMQAEKRIGKAMVIDCDVHQGNGTASIFAGDASVFTFSIHQEHNYPAEKPPSDLDVNLENLTGDEAYLEALADALEPSVPRFGPDLIVYVAGADPFMEDQLGGLLLTKTGLIRRDEFVYQLARQHRVPVATVLAGGYSFRVDDTVDIHCNTVRAAARTFNGLVAPAEVDGERDGGIDG